MKSFSPGVFRLQRPTRVQLPCLRSRSFSGRPTCQPIILGSARSLHSSFAKLADANVATKSNDSKNPKPIVPKPQDFDTVGGVQNLLGREGYAVIRELASAKEPVVLYKSPPQLGFRLTAYLQSLGTLAASEATGAILFPAGQQVGVGNFVLVTLGFTAVMWSVLGMWLAGAPMNVVRSITAVPKRQSVPGSSVGRKLLMLRIEYTWMPLLKNKVVEVQPSELLAREPIGRVAWAFQHLNKTRESKANTNAALRLLGSVAKGSRKILDWTKVTVVRQRLIPLETPRGKLKVDYAGTFPKGEIAVDALIPWRDDEGRR